MSAACFPAYWLARQVVRPTYALLAAAATVAAPGMLYSAYLLSEPLAYPVFLARVRRLRPRARRGPRRAGGWPPAAVSLVAVGTRMQFVALPLVFGLVLRPRRRSAPARCSACSRSALAAVARRDGRPRDVRRDLAPRLRRARGRALGRLDRRPRALRRRPRGRPRRRARPRPAGRPRRARDAERAFARLDASACGGVPRAGRRHRRGRLGAAARALRDLPRPARRDRVLRLPRARRAAAQARTSGSRSRSPRSAGSCPSRPSRTTASRSTRPSSRRTASSRICSATRTRRPSSAVAAARRSWRVVVWRPRVARAARRSACMLATGAAAYAGDHAMTERSRAAFAPAQPDWLDEGGYGHADFLGLAGRLRRSSPGRSRPGTATSAGRSGSASTRRRSIRGPSGRATVADDGTLTRGRQARRRRPPRRERLRHADRPRGRVVARPRDGLTLVRVPAAPRVSSLAEGLYYDGWARGNLRYRTWPADAGPGAYRVVLSLPAGADEREVLVEVEGGARRAVTLEPGGESVGSSCPPTARRRRCTSRRTAPRSSTVAPPAPGSSRSASTASSIVPGARFTRTGSRSGVLGL